MANTMHAIQPFPVDLSELMAAAEFLPVGISIIDLELKTRFWNRAFMEILDFPESLMRPGATLEDFIRFNAERGDYGPGDPEEQVRTRVELARKFEPHRFFRIRKDGRIVEINGRLIYDQQGGMVGFVTLYQDVTVEKRYEQELEAKNRQLHEAYEDLKQAQLQLLQTEKMASLGQLAAGIAHEINNPVGFVMSNYQTVEQDFRALLDLIERYQAMEQHLPPDARAALQDARRDIELDYLKEDRPVLFKEIRDGLVRVKDIVDQLKSFAHDRPGKWVSADLAHLMERALGVAVNAFGKRITVDRRYEEACQIDCLASELTQVFLAMLVNAAQAIEAQGTVSIRIRRQDDKALIDIADTGKGIAAEQLSQIFDPFFTTRDVGAGKGLGLAVAYNVVKEHGGNISVTSTPGKGTSFTISLPLVAVHMKKASSGAFFNDGL